MTKEELYAFGMTKGYTVLQDSLFGTWQGYPFHCIRLNGRQCQVLITVEGKIPAAFIRSLRREFRGKHCAAQMRQAGQVILLLNRTAQPEEFAENMAEGMEVVARALREGGFLPPGVCPLCSRTGCDSTALVKGRYVQVHRGCLEQNHQNTVERVENNHQQGSYVTGFIGALLGGLVGVLPNVLSVVLMDRIYAMLYALIPLCAYFGYKLLRGKLTRAAFACTLISSLLNLLSMEYVLLYCQFVDLYGTAVSPAVVGRVYMEMLMSGNLWQGLLYSLIFLALGLWISWGIITQTNSHQVQFSANGLATLRPLEGACNGVSSR